MTIAKAITSRRSEMNDEMKKFWDQKLVEIATAEPLFQSTRKLTWKEKLHNRYLNLIDAIYEKLTGHCPYEE